MCAGRQCGVGGVAFADGGERGQDGGGAFQVGVLDPAAVKKLCGVEQLEVGTRASAFVAAKAVIEVLHCEECVDVVVVAGGWDQLEEATDQV